MSINQHKVEEAIREVRRLRTTPGFDENGLLTEMRGAVPLESSAEWADFMSRLSASAEKPEEPKLGGAGGAVAGPGAAGGREVAVTTSGQGGQIDEIDRILKKLTESEAVRPEIIRSIGTEAAGLRETLQRIFVSGIARKPVIITYDTALEPRSREAVQAGEKAVEGYLGGSLFVVRKTGKAVLAGIDEAVAELAKKIGKQPQEIKINVDYTLVTIAGDATLAVPEVAGAKDRGTLGKILNVQTDGRLYMPIIGMYDLALKIAYDFEPEKLAECLNRIALNTATGQPFTPEEVADFLRKGLIPVLPRIGPVDTNEAAAAYKAAQAVLQAL
jgi:hypothetical protein